MTTPMEPTIEAPEAQGVASHSDASIPPPGPRDQPSQSRRPRPLPTRPPPRRFGQQRSFSRTYTMPGPSGSLRVRLEPIPSSSVGGVGSPSRLSSLLPGPQDGLEHPRPLSRVRSEEEEGDDESEEGVTRGGPGEYRESLYEEEGVINLDSDDEDDGLDADDIDDDELGSPLKAEDRARWDREILLDRTILRRRGSFCDRRDVDDSTRRFRENYVEFPTRVARRCLMGRWTRFHAPDPDGIKRRRWPVWRPVPARQRLASIAKRRHVLAKSRHVSGDEGEEEGEVRKTRSPPKQRQKRLETKEEAADMALFDGLDKKRRLKKAAVTTKLQLRKLRVRLRRNLFKISRLKFSEYLQNMHLDRRIQEAAAELEKFDSESAQGGGDFLTMRRMASTRKMKGKEEDGDEDGAKGKDKDKDDGAEPEEKGEDGKEVDADAKDGDDKKEEEKNKKPKEKASVRCKRVFLAGGVLIQKALSSCFTVPKNYLMGLWRDKIAAPAEIRSESLWYLVWRIFIWLIYLYYFLSVTFRLSFSAFSFEGQVHVNEVILPLYFLDILSDLVIVGNWFYHRRRPWINFVFWLPLDWGFVWLFQYLGWVVALLRINKIPFLMFEFKSTFQFIERRVGLARSWVQVGKYYLLMMLVFHVMACIWYVVLAHDALPNVYAFTLHEDLPSLTDFETYLYALHWCLVTMTGYGGTAPTSLMQVVYGLFVCLVGVAMYVATIGNVFSLMEDMEMKNSLKKVKLNRMEKYLGHLNIDSVLRERVLEHYRFLSFQRTWNEKKILKALPRYLRVKVSLDINKNIVEKVNLFEGTTNDNFIAAVVLNLKPRSALPGTVIIKKGDLGQEMFFLVSGTVAVYGTQEAIDAESFIVELGPGSYFGEIALVTKQTRNAFIVAQKYCDLYVLLKKDFDKLELFYPQEFDQIRKVAKKRAEQTAAQKKKTDSEKKRKEKRRKEKKRRRRRGLLGNLSQAHKHGRSGGQHRHGHGHRRRRHDRERRGGGEKRRSRKGKSNLKNLARRPLRGRSLADVKTRRTHTIATEKVAE